MFNAQAIKRTLMLVAGFLAAFLILFTQLAFTATEAGQQEIAISAEQDATEIPQQEIFQFKVSAISLPSSLIINYQQLLPVLFELILSDEVPDMPELPFEISSTEWIKNLFRVFIAPNAP